MKLFLSDLDGTLMDVHGNIQKQDVQAIHTLTEHGIAFGIVTGRDYGFCQKLIRRYRLAAALSGFVMRRSWRSRSRPGMSYALWSF